MRPFLPGIFANSGDSGTPETGDKRWATATALWATAWQGSLGSLTDASLQDQRHHMIDIYGDEYLNPFNMYTHMYKYVKTYKHMIYSRDYSLVDDFLHMQCILFLKGGMMTRIGFQDRVLEMTKTTTYA